MYVRGHWDNETIERRLPPWKWHRSRGLITSLLRLALALREAKASYPRQSLLPCLVSHARHSITTAFQSRHGNAKRLDVPRQLPLRRLRLGGGLARDHVRSDVQLQHLLQEGRHIRLRLAELPALDQGLLRGIHVLLTHRRILRQGCRGRPVHEGGLRRAYGMRLPSVLGDIGELEI